MRSILFLALALMPVCSAAMAPGPPDVTIAAGAGQVIFDPARDGQAYRYGPSMIVNPDRSIDAWFASPGGTGPEGVNQWDWIRHKRSKDGGRSWTPEAIVLKPTARSLDRLSVCDPGVIRFGGWYYLGTTAVDNDPGNRNEVFVARSRKPEGPYEKWNGSGWGGDPKPIVEFHVPADAWGAGEPSFVLVGKTLNVYYTWWVTVNPSGPVSNQTRLATAVIDGPNWPAGLRYGGVMWDREEGEDSADVKYVDSLRLYVAVSSASRMGPKAHIIYRTSRDGTTWSAPGRVTGEIQTWCHNVGMSGDATGHIRPGAPVYLGYAFSKDPKVNWGFWHTLLHPIRIEARPSP